MKILLADDDRDLVDLLSYVFKRHGHTPVGVYDGQAALQAFHAISPDLVILDLNMPRLGGRETLRELRKHSQVPVIILTAVGDEDRLVSAFEEGADDYIVKPFRHRELVVRADALLRRNPTQSGRAAAAAKAMTCGDIAIDPRRREVSVAGSPLRLTRTEFNLLYYLMLNQGTVLSVSDIISNIWGFDSEVSEDAVMVSISRLRHKVEPDPAHPRYIVTTPGAGYMFCTVA